MSKDIVLVSSGYDMTIRFWSDFNNNSQCKYQIEWKDNAINALEMTPNKDYVAFASGNSVKFIDLHTLNPSPVVSIDSHEGLVNSILIPQNFDNCFISSGEDSSVRINDIRAGKGVMAFYHNNFVNSVEIANGNKDIIAADENGCIRIWDKVKSEMRHEYKSNLNEEGLAFRSIALAEKDGFLVGAKTNGNCVVFNYNSKESPNNMLSVLNTFAAHNSYITKCVLNPENELLATCSADNSIKVWKRKGVSEEYSNERKSKNNNLSKEFEEKTKLIGHKKWVWDCDFSLDSKYILSCSSDRTIRIWDLDASKTISTLTSTKGVNNIALADDDNGND